MNEKYDDSKMVTYRYHPLYIVKPIFRSLVVFVIFFSQELLSILEGDLSLKELLSEGLMGGLLLGFGIYGLILLPALINAAITYFKSQVDLSKETINYRKVTFFSKTSKETALNQITNLNFNRSILDRIFSTVDLHLDIDSSQTANESDYSILLSLEDAEEFKQIFDQYSQEQEGEELTKDEKERYPFSFQYEYSNLESWRHIFLSSSSLIPLFIFSLIILFFTDFLPNFSMFSVIILFISFAVNIIKNISKYYDYKVKANSQSINWQSGLFKNKEFTISKNNIRAIELHQTLIARIFNYYSLDIEVVGVGNDGEELMTVILYKKREELITIMEEILPEHQLKLSYQREKLLVGFYKGLVFSLITFPILFIPIVQNYFWLYFIMLLLIIMCNILISKGRGINLDKEAVEIRSAFMGLCVTRIAIKNIDHIKIIKRPLFSKLGLNKIKFYYKSNTGASQTISGYFPKKIFSAFIKQYIH